MKFSSLLIVISFTGFLVSCWNRNDLPDDIEYQPQVFEAPQQTTTRKTPFEVSYKGVAYLVEPEYDYELYGMIVSYRHHDGNSHMHLRSNDKLNMLDVCVIWGDNAHHPNLRNINFWNGIFTCNYKTRDQQAWNNFDIFQISNNHLLSDDELIRDKVKDIRIGDQIRVRGFLASYGSAGGGKRGTSITRMDSGDGACETVFVEQFEVVRQAVSKWRTAMYGFVIVLFGGLGIHFARPFKPYKNG